VAKIKLAKIKLSEPKWRKYDETKFSQNTVTHVAVFNPIVSSFQPQRKRSFIFEGKARGCAPVNKKDVCRMFTA